MAMRSRILARTVLALAAVAGCLLVVPAPASAQPEEKVTLCHRTSSRTNPYNQMAVAKSSAVDGHKSHTGPVFSPDVASWGDIIPPIKPGLPKGRNWTNAGRAVLDNGCEVPPDVGPLPGASIADAACTGTTPTVDVTVSNAADATDPATFTIRVDGAPVQTVGPIAPGGSQTVTLTGAPEDTVAVIDVVSGGKVIDSRVVTADCAPGPPAVALQANLVCAGTAARAAIRATNNGPTPIDVALQVDGTQVGPTITVAPGATETRAVDVSSFEDQTVTARLLVDGTPVATTTVTPDCVPPAPHPAARVAGTVCPPPSATVTLANTGDPDSKIVYGIRVNARPVQTSAPLYGGDATTIVVDLTPFEDRTVLVAVGANGTVAERRVLHVNCVADGSGGDGSGGDGSGGGSGGTSGTEGSSPAALPLVGAAYPRWLPPTGLGLVAVGGALILVSLVRRSPRR